MDLHGKMLSEGLANLGDEVDIISTRHPDNRIIDRQDNVRVHYLQNTSFGARREGWAKNSVDYFFALHRKSLVHVIWSQSFDAFGLAKLDRRRLPPIVAILHGSIAQESRSVAMRICGNFRKPGWIIRSIGGLFFSYAMVQRPFLALADAIITVDGRVTDDLCKWYGNHIRKKCETVANGVDTKYFRPDTAAGLAIRKRYSIEDTAPVLLTLGRLTYEKGHHVAIEAFSKVAFNLPGARLMIVGEGPERECLKAHARAKNLAGKVVFTGAIDNSETVGYYNAANAFLMPTLTVEGLPFVILEAMACGKAVIASRVGGNRSIIADRENGYLVPVGNADEIAKAFLTVMKVPDTAHRIGRSARVEIKKRFSAEIMVKRTRAVFSRLNTSKRLADGSRVVK